MQNMPELPESWCRPDEQQAQALCREAIAEIGPDHELAGRRLMAIATCSACDDVAFQVDDGTFAIVHLTWARRPEPRPYPTTRRVGNVLALQQAARDHSDRH